MPTTEAEPTGNDELTGRCLCGAVRYRLRTRPTGAGWCHCRSCQLNSGSPAMAFASVPIADCIVEHGEEALARFASSDEAERWFCGKCGTPLWVQDRQNPVSRDFSLATLDRPDAVEPQFHMFWDSRIAWDRPADNHPRFARNRAEAADRSPNEPC